MNNEKKNKLIIKAGVMIVLPIIFIGAAAIVAIALLNLSYWLKILFIVLIVLLIFVNIFGLCIIDWMCSYFECPKCHKVYKPSFKQYVFSIHKGANRKLKCPVCNEKDYFKRVFSKDEFSMVEAGKGDPIKEYSLISVLEDENGFENKFFGISYEKYVNEVLPKFDKDSKGIDLPEGYVPQTTFYFYLNDIAIGFYKVRHYCNEVTRHSGAGHIGYAIRKEYRGNGYAAIGLKFAIEELKKMPDFDKNEGIIMGCHKDNLASLKTQEKNGAVIIEETETDFITKITL